MTDSQPTSPSPSPARAGEVIAITRDISATFAAGLERIHLVIERDGALAAADKALLVAVAAANRGRDELMSAELTRARTLGIGGADADGAGLALLLARGEAAFADFARAAKRIFGERADVRGGGHAAAAPTSPAQALDYFREHFGGEVPLRQRVFAEIAPLAFEGYQLMHRAALKENPLSAKTVELVMCSINASDYQGAFLEIHIAGARSLGAGESEIAEAVLCAIPAAGIAVWPGAAEAIIRTRS
jgi:alkylhydroperoxidase/carboxymuconolactone decarboxylase family protein YurZ